MTIGAPTTWASGNALTATKLKDEVEDQFTGLFSPPRARLSDILLDTFASQSAATMHTTVAAGNLVHFNTSDVMTYTGSMITGSAPYSRLIAPIAGIYEIEAVGSMAPNTNGLRGSILRVNGATWIDVKIKPAVPTAVGVAVGVGGAVGNTSVRVATDYKMAAGDYVEFFMNQSSGGNLNIQAYSGYMSLVWIGNSA